MFTKTSLVFMAILLLIAVPAMIFAGGDQEEGGEMESGKEAIRIGWVAPFTGPLSVFTQAVKFVEEQAMPIINADGGIYVEEYGKKVPVKIIWADSESSPTKASEAASKLVLSDKVDFLIGSWTPDTINPVSAVAERNKIPAYMENGPDNSWLTGGPYTWAYGNLFSLDNMVESFFDAVDRAETNKKVGFIFDNLVDGILISELAQNACDERGYTVVDPGRFPAGTKDYTAIINEFKKEDVDIVVANMITPDFGAAWNQFHQQDFIPKIFWCGKGLHFTSDVEALGEGMGEGLISEDMWSETYPYVCSLNGQDAKELTEAWEEASGKPADCTLGYDWSTFEVIYDVFKRAQSVDREKVLKALDETDFQSAYGHIKFDDRNITEPPVVISQWVEGEQWAYEKNVISNRRFPEIELAEEGIQFIPGSE